MYNAYILSFRITYRDPKGLWSLLRRQMSLVNLYVSTHLFSLLPFLVSGISCKPANLQENFCLNRMLGWRFSKFLSALSNSNPEARGFAGQSEKPRLTDSYAIGI